ncbi:MAG TPA: VOC family protein [Stellaceae bacterium]|jgi:catechol 2,3-dioxygenase-like lactoylglutathione lyase family enzyme|nr:VOC family protein [Stellaceae bacterium]
MIDHLTIGVGDIARSRAFYDAALAPLGYRRSLDHGEGSGYSPTDAGPGVVHPRDFWIVAAAGATAAPGFHFAFKAPHRPAVDAFHAAALGAGGRDYGAPGLRPRYHANYYGAFVIDPDGHRIEAVCHIPT